MKRILLLTLVIGVFLLSACGAPTTAPPAEAPPAPPPTEPEPAPAPEEAPDYTPWIASELRNLNTAMIGFTSGVSTSLAKGYDGYVIRPYVFNEEEGEVLIHMFSPGSPWAVWLPASALSEARTHIYRAYWLTNKSKLPKEVMTRDVSTDEIAQEVSKAISLLKVQVASSYSWEEGHIKWITEHTSPQTRRDPADQLRREIAILNLIEIYDEYREVLSKMIHKLELILSRLPSATKDSGELVY